MYFVLVPAGDAANPVPNYGRHLLVAGQHFFKIQEQFHIQVGLTKALIYYVIQTGNWPNNNLINHGLAHTL